MRNDEVISLKVMAAEEMHVITNKNLKGIVFSAIPFFFIALLILMKVVFAQSWRIDSSEGSHLSLRCLATTAFVS